MAYYANGYNNFAGASYAPTASFASGYPFSAGYSAGYNAVPSYGYPAVSSAVPSYGYPAVSTADYTASAGLPFSTYSGAGFASSSYGLPTSAGYFNTAYTASAPTAYSGLSAAAYPGLSAAYGAAPFASAYGNSSYLQQGSLLGGLTASLPFGATNGFAAQSSLALAPYQGITGFPGFSSFANFPGANFGGAFPGAFAGAFPGQVIGQEQTLIPNFNGEIPPLGNETVTVADAVETVEARSATPPVVAEEGVEAGASQAF